MGDASPGRLFLKTGKEVRPIRIAQGAESAPKAESDSKFPVGEVLEVKAAYSVMVPGGTNVITVKTRPAYLGPDGYINLTVQEVETGKNFGTVKLDASSFNPETQLYENRELKAVEPGDFQLIASIPGGGRKFSKSIVEVKEQFGLVWNHSSWPIFIQTETRGRLVLLPSKDESYIAVDGVFQNLSGAPRFLDTETTDVVRKISDGTSFIVEDTDDKINLILRPKPGKSGRIDEKSQWIKYVKPDKAPGWKDEQFRDRYNWGLPPTLDDFLKARKLHEEMR